MTWLVTAWSEFIGLFVDDLPYAASIVAWLACCWLLLPHLALPPALPPVLLFAGLAAILAGSALMKARNSALLSIP